MHSDTTEDQWQSGVPKTLVHVRKGLWALMRRGLLSRTDTSNNYRLHDYYIHLQRLNGSTTFGRYDKFAAQSARSIQWEGRTVLKELRMMIRPKVGWKIIEGRFHSCIDSNLFIIINRYMHKMHRYLNTKQIVPLSQKYSRLFNDLHLPTESQLD